MHTRIRKLLTATAVVTCLGTPAAIALSSTSAQAAPVTAAHVRPLTGVHLSLFADPSKSIVTHGSYNQVTIDTSGAANFTIAVVGTKNGNNIVELTDGNGNCLASNDAGTKAVIKPGACATTNTSENWEQNVIDPGVPDAQFINQLTNTMMGTESKASGTGVEVASGLPYVTWID